MPDDEAHARPRTTPTVERVPHELGAEQHAQLTAFVRRDWAARAEASARAADLALRALAPVRRLMQADADAARAISELQKARRVEFEGRAARTRPSRVFGGGASFDSLFPHVNPGINVFVAPYDFEIGEAHGNAAEATADRFDGTASLSVGGFLEEHARFGSAGWGLALKASIEGVAHVRPLWRCQFVADARGWLLGSHTEGAVKVLVQDAFSGAVIKQVTQPLWNFDNDNKEDTDEYISSSALGVDFPVQTGQVLSVSFLADAMTDASGPLSDNFMGYSGAWAALNMRLLLVVVELG